MNFLEIKKVVFFEPKNWWKDDITDYWKVHVLNFSVMGNKVFFWVKNLMQRWYLLVTEKFLFWTFRWWEIRSFFSQKVDGQMIFTWSFWAFHDIPGLGKYGFSYSDSVFQVLGSSGSYRNVNSQSCRDFGSSESYRNVSS